MKLPELIFVCIALAFFTLPLSAGDISQEEIVCKLDPKCQKPLTRGITLTKGKMEKEPLSVNLYVNFAYNSDELSSDARITLDQLGAALRDSRLAGFSFLIAGHTDAKGSAAYNQKLSERRAEAVKRYLISQYKLSPQRLSTVGYGMAQLLDPSRPEDAVNRRVQIINTTAGNK